jgi:hypothetical protein
VDLEARVDGSFAPQFAEGASSFADARSLIQRIEQALRSWNSDA